MTTANADTPETPDVADPCRQVGKKDSASIRELRTQLREMHDAIDPLLTTAQSRVYWTQQWELSVVNARLRDAAGRPGQ